MLKRHTLLTAGLISVCLSSPARAEDAPDPAGEKIVELSGVYAIWALNQRNFMLGNPDVVLDDADYVVQMLRVNAKLGREKYGVVTRFDAAQGWWGTDNDPNVEETTSVDADGNVTSATTYNPYKLFRDKDTNYDVHFDHAYAFVELPGLSFPLRVQAGRQYMKAGHQLVLDQDLDGVKVMAAPAEGFSLELLWAKMSEGAGSVKAPTGLLLNDSEEWADANLFGGSASFKLDPATVELFGLYYLDSGSGAAYLPTGLGYFNARFQPEVSQLTALGLSVDGTLDVAGGLKLELEGDYLFGADDIKNTDHAGGALDINDGTLSGFNAYARVTQKIDAAVPFDVGAAFGMGSGDDDPTGGPGNVNKIQTMGFFPFTNVWEDSVMPDVGGISPQGLGSPVSRGYREFENTTAVQAAVGVVPWKPLRLEASYTWLKATQPIFAYDATGTPGTASATDLGQEIDANLHLTVYKGFGYKALFGYFIPGEAAGYLINGVDTYLDPAWEVKQVVTAKF
jgi:hypothetical protein